MSKIRKLRRWGKSILAAALYRTGSDDLIGQVSGLRNFPLVLGYHRVVDDFKAYAGNCIPGLLMSQKMLEHHLEWLGSRFRFVSADELDAELQGCSGSSKPAVAITFDDGYRDFYHYAFPILKRKGIPAAIFVVTGLVGSSEVPFDQRFYLLLRAFAHRKSRAETLGGLLRSLGIHRPDLERIELRPEEPFPAMSKLLHALSQADIFHLIRTLEERIQIPENILQDLRPLDWDMLAEMHQAGITVGSHTQSHPLLTNESFSKVLDETVVSRQEIEKRLGFQTRHFAYPCGRFNPLVVSAVAAAEYAFAYTTCSHRDASHPRLTIPRTVLWENSCLDPLEGFSPALISCQVNRIFDWLDACRQSHARPWPPEIEQTAVLEAGLS